MAMTISQMNQKWTALSMREKCLVFVAGLIAIWGLLDTFLVNPQRTLIANTQLETTQKQEQLAKMQAQIATLSSQGQNSEKNQKLKALDDLNAKISGQEGDLLKLTGEMISPQEIVPVLKQLLQKHPDVQVVEMTSLPEADFIKKQLESDKSTQSTTDSKATIDMSGINIDTIYQHGIKVKVSGSYASVMGYAQALKSLGRTVAWEKVELESHYPVTELTVYLYTLSKQNAWLGL